MALPTCPLCGGDFEPDSTLVRTAFCQSCQPRLLDTTRSRTTLVHRDSQGTLKEEESIELDDQFLARFELEGMIGAGTTSTVYQALDRTANRKVAIKILRQPEDKEQLQRFRQEGRLLTKLRHPRLLSVLELGAIARHPFIVCELAADGTLAELVAKSGALDVGRAVHLFLDILLGLRQFHGDGILHRDVKPANIFLFGDRAKLGDLSIAYRYEDNDGEPSHDEIVGTLRYMAPEQLRGEPASVASDVYAAALVFYEMLTGHHALDPSTMICAMRGEAYEIRPLGYRLGDLGPLLAHVLKRSLDVDPAKRYMIAYHFSQALLEVAKKSPWGADAGWRPHEDQIERGSSHPALMARFRGGEPDPW